MLCALTLVGPINYLSTHACRGIACANVAMSRSATGKLTKAELQEVQVEGVRGSDRLVAMDDGALHSPTSGMMIAALAISHYATR